MRNHIAIAICLLSSLGCTTFGTAQSNSFVGNFYCRAGLGVNINYHYAIKDPQEKWNEYWASVGGSAGYRNDYFSLGITYQQPSHSLYPPKRIFHNWFFEAQLNLLSVAGQKLTEKAFIGPMFFWGQTTGFDDVNVDGKIEFDDRISGFGGVFSYQIKPGISLFSLAYQFKFVDDNIVVVGQTNDKSHRNFNLTFGVIVKPFSLKRETN